MISSRFDEDAGFWRLIAGSGSNNGSVVAPVDQMATGMITVQMNRYRKFCRNYQTVQMYQSFLSVTHIFFSELCGLNEEASYLSLLTVCSIDEFTCSDGEDPDYE